LLLLFLVQLGVCFGRLFSPSSSHAAEHELALLFFALVATTAGMNRELPLQNLLLACLVIAVSLSAAAVAAIDTAVGVHFLHHCGVTGTLPHVSWTLPMFWVVVCCPRAERQD
jgi:hypothetical protein